jgi:hypothetical protein
MRVSDYEVPLFCLLHEEEGRNLVERHGNTQGI